MSVKWAEQVTGKYINSETNAVWPKTYVANSEFRGSNPKILVNEQEGTFEIPTGLTRRAFSSAPVSRSVTPLSRRRSRKSEQNAEAARIRATESWSTGILTLPPQGNRPAETISTNRGALEANSSASSVLFGGPIQIMNHDYFPEAQKSDNYHRLNSVNATLLKNVEPDPHVPPAPQNHRRGRHNINSANFNSVNATLLKNVKPEPHVPDNTKAEPLRNRTSSLGHALNHVHLTSVGGSRTRRRKRQRARPSRRRYQ